MAFSCSKRHLGVLELEACRQSLLLLAWLAVTCANPSSSIFWTTTSFVPPASPSIASSSPAPTQTVGHRNLAVATGYGTFSNNKLPSATALLAKKKGGGAKKKAGGGKVQVKLLKHVAGTGQAGEVILVTPAFFQNKLRPTKSAVVISDEEVQKETAEKQAKEEATMATATTLKETISEVSLEIPRKAGPDGQLFGGVGPKCILDELKKEVQDDFLKGKGVKIISVTGDDGKKLPHDIKHIGEFDATISLRKGIDTKFKVKVVSEN